jgi:hypothetical protein
MVKPPFDIQQGLVSKKAADRVRAAKAITKGKVVSLTDDLFAAYVKERADTRTWEAQTEMIRALGVLDHKPALPLLTEIVRKNEPHDLITATAATSFVQLKRTSLNDAKPVLELLEFGNLSVITGALNVLAIDRMVPPKSEAEKIIQFSWNINKHKDRLGQEWGYIDPRMHLAIACAGWDPTVAHDFLIHCIATAQTISRFNEPNENVHLVEFCKKALKGKYAAL